MIQRPKGTKDLLPQESYMWQFVENEIKNILENYGFREIRVPVFEHTELFLRGVGDTTDVVQKEMYTFDDKGGRSITLRPEGTAGIVRAYIENGMASQPSPQKMWYNLPMYRYENVQKGRLREFHQVGAEIFGTASYLADVQLIIMADQILKALKLPDIELEINSIGCKKCRAEYQNALKDFFADKIEEYCETCQTRLNKNPMRILDCKEEKCKKLNEGAPSILDYLCEECKEHFENVKHALTQANIGYKINARIVRGLDYYTKTVFEFVSKTDGYTVLGGGRYDDLAEELGGTSTPAVGFALGVERLMELFSKYEGENIKMKAPKLYIVSMGENAAIYANNLATDIRKAGIYVETDICSRSVKAQFKHADKINAKYVITIGDSELETKTAVIKEMETGDTKEVTLNDELVKNLIEIL